ncbi:TetR family transcriptional regulator [Rhodococcoides trifolii]|uniref:TetR family transcriptional regulator n=1 Tax=Rhodococcoides trifolii TaxID=908250 RepID=A0A917LEL0_9NOCA|nr:helix-turn-helix domain-containing protein [Rhodococcus trifolii]GGG16443.1 TetR family transcriptional regulator [Rhodococcus trifolii]
MSEQRSTASVKRAPDLRERRRQETKFDIACAALDLFERQGSSATTVDQIAAEAGISPSTFFRCFPSKEESVLEIDAHLESDLGGWLDSTLAAEITMTGIQEVYARSIERVSSSPDARDRLLRTRRLIGGDAHLRAAAFAAEAMALCRITDRVTQALSGTESRTHARLLVEGAGMAVRVAFDDWAERIDGGENADLGEIYRSTADELARVVRR